MNNVSETRRHERYYFSFLAKIGKKKYIFVPQLKQATEQYLHDSMSATVCQKYARRKLLQSHTKY